MFTTVITAAYAAMICVLVAWVIRERRRARRLSRMHTTVGLPYSVSDR